MNQCKQCGATLPEDSRYCLQCGTENTVGTPQEQAEPDFLKPAALGGLLMTVLSNIPYLMYGNVLCCLWIQLGGGLTVWLLDKQRPGSVKYSDGALAGVLSGLIAAIISTILFIPIQIFFMTPEWAATMKAQFEQGQMPPAAMDMAMRFMAPGFDMSRTLIVLVLSMVINGLFAMIGGIITTAILASRKRSTDQS
jgi:hypothetical protein